MHRLCRGDHLFVGGFFGVHGLRSWVLLRVERVGLRLLRPRAVLGVGLKRLVFVMCRRNILCSWRFCVHFMLVRFGGGSRGLLICEY